MGPAAESRRDSDDVEQDPGFLRRLWIGQRIGWAFMAVVLVIALFGGFGRGPLAGTSAGDPETLAVHFDRLSRHESRSELLLDVPPLEGRERVTVWVDARFLDDFRVERVTPEPESVLVDGGRVLHELAMGPSGGTVRFDGKPERSGVHHARVGIFERGHADGATVDITQLVLP